MKLIAFIILHLVSSIVCQVINFEKYGGSKWPNHQVPYVISPHFTDIERNAILDSIRQWNEDLRQCIELKPRNGESDYVDIISANGCWSYTGKIGGRQEISLQHDGCLYQTTIWHQFMHSLGFAHEHSREDRDNHVEVLWDNIPREWHSQYQKVNSDYFVTIGAYDYYSIMHYPYLSPGTNQAAFKVRNPTVDIKRMGYAQTFSPSDLENIRQFYC